MGQIDYGRLSALESALGGRKAVNELFEALKTYNARLVRGFPLTHDMPRLHSGVALFTPAPGDLLLDAWFQIDTAWDGTTPRADIGTKLASIGVFGNVVAPIDMTQADYELVGSIFSASNMPLSQQIALINLFPGVELNAIPPTLRNLVLANPVVSNPGGFGNMRFSTEAPINVWISQDGQNTGTDPGATQGSGTLYVVTVTPV